MALFVRNNQVRSQMEETDVFKLENVIEDQKKLIEELKIKGSFYTPNETTDIKPKKTCDGGIVIKLGERQLDFIRKKYIESLDYDDETTSFLPGGGYTKNEATFLLETEKNIPGSIDDHITNWMLYRLLGEIQERLIEHCGYSENDFDDGDLIDQFEELK